MVIRLLLYANARPSYHIRAEYVYTNKTTNENKTHPVLSCLKKQLTSTCKASSEELFYLKLPHLLSPFLKHVSKRHNQKSLK